MRVFVTGTGRCGSVTFSRACATITNFTSSHEAIATDLAYPDNHIEVNCQLHSCIERLVLRYPDAFFVHLIRRRDECIESLAAMDHGRVMLQYWSIYPTVVSVGGGAIDVAESFYDSVTARIDSAISNIRSNRRFVFRLECSGRDWKKFLFMIRAQSDPVAGAEVWKSKFNTREDRGEFRRS